MYCFLINPVSGRGSGKKVWMTVKAELERLNVAHEDFVLRYKGEAGRLAEGLSKRTAPVTIVVVGGDGTLNEVLNSLHIHPNLTLGCIPTGSGNDFVRGLGLKTDPIEALHAILSPSDIRRIRIGTVTCSFPDRQSTTRFGVSSGIGFDAAVCYDVNRSRLKDFLNWFHLGKLVYTGVALRQLFGSELYPMCISIDDKPEQTYDRVFFAAAMNLAYEGGGFMFAPDADPTGEDFYLCFAEGISRFRVLTLLPLASSGKHVGKTGIHLVPFKKAVIRSRSPLCVHTDGETIGFCDTLTYEAHDARLSVIVG